MLAVTLPVPFNPAIESWFASRFGMPTPPQRDGWPPIREGRNTLPEAVTLLRAVRKRTGAPGDPHALVVSAADPLNFRGILTPEERVPPTRRQQVRVA